MGGFLATLHVLAAIAALGNGLPLWLRLPLAAGVAVSGWRQLLALRQPETLAIHADAEGNFEVLGRSGTRFGTLSAGTVITRWLVILQLDTETGKLLIPLCRDSLDPETFRRLRVLLRILPTAQRRA